MGAYRSHCRPAGPSIVYGLAIMAVGTTALLVLSDRSSRRSRHGHFTDAPRKTLRRVQSGVIGRQGTLVGRSVTINRPRQELYSYWRDFAQLPDFMENVHSIDVLDERHSRWVVKGPAGTDVDFETIVTEDRPNEIIAWESSDASDIKTSGRVTFKDAPAGRGTVVSATIAYDPPGGRIGQLAAKLFQREPNVQARRELKRFKQLMETGEITTTEPGPAAPRA